jgi:AcrR family transcriptional regulator
MLINQEQEKKLDPRIKRTRQLLQQALLDLMGETSFEAITVKEIAERATLNRVTFYAHFQDKYALLEYTVRQMIRQRLRSQVPEGTPYSPENLARLVLTVCEFLAEMERHCPPPHGQMDPLMEKQIKAELHEILEGWLAEMWPDESNRSPTLRGPTLRGPTLEQAAMVTSWSIYGAAMQWLQQERRKPAAEYVEQVLPLILGSLEPTVG